MDSDQLREQAERWLDREPTATLAAVRDDRDLVRELRLHQIELEMQNQALRESQVALEAARDRYWELYDQAPVGYLTLSRAGVIEEANLAAARLFGQSRRLLVGRPVGHLLTVEGGARILEHCGQVLATRLPQRCEVRTLGGAVLQVESAPAGDARGRPFCRTVLVDVTAQRESERQVRAAQARMAAILETTPDGILTVDAKGRVETCNAAARRLFGLTEEALLGRGIETLLGGWHRACRTGGGEVTGRRDDGGAFPADLGVGVLRAPEGDKLTAVVRDTSGRKELEREFLQSQKMEAVGRLAAAVSHDFNNLLAGISGMCGMLHRHLDDGHPGHKLVDLLADAVTRGSGLTRQLTSFSRRGYDTDEPPAAVDDVVEETTRLFESLMGSDVKVDWRLDAAGARVRCDRTRILQILMNLLVNARDAMPSGGTFVLETTRVRRGEPTARRAPGRYVLVKVTDGGMGMDAETRERALEPFFTTKPADIGTGLGLSTIQGILQTVGGMIEIESALGVGTTVSVWLPELEAEPAARAAAAATPRRDTRQTVLLMEPEALTRACAAESLTGSGYHVVEAGSQADFLSLLETHGETIDVLVTGAPRPGTAGSEGADRAASLPTLVLQPPGEGGSARPEDGVTVLDKPFTERALLQTVHRVIGPQRRRPRRGRTSARSGPVGP